MNCLELTSTTKAGLVLSNTGFRLKFSAGGPFAFIHAYLWPRILAEEPGVQQQCFHGQERDAGT